MPLCWGRFPYGGGGTDKLHQLYKCRPVLIFAAIPVNDARLPKDALKVVIAMGTSDISGDESQPDAIEFLLPIPKGGKARENHTLITGTWKDTLFQFDVLNVLYYNSDWFEPPERRSVPSLDFKTPQIGYFPPTAAKNLDVLLYGEHGEKTEFQDKVNALLNLPAPVPPPANP